MSKHTTETTNETCVRPDDFEVVTTQAGDVAILSAETRISLSWEEAMWVADELILAARKVAEDLYQKRYDQP